MEWKDLELNETQEAGRDGIVELFTKLGMEAEDGIELFLHLADLARSNIEAGVLD